MEIIVVFSVVVFIGSCIIFRYYRRMRSIALNRSDSDVCRYARSFDYGNVDIKILRKQFSANGQS